MQETVAKKDAMIKYIVHGSWATLRLSIAGLARSFHMAFNKSISYAFLLSSVDEQLYTDNTTDGITLFFWIVRRLRR